MTSETRIMEMPVQTVNGLKGFVMNAGSPWDYGEIVSKATNDVLNMAAYLGIRVWKRDSTGTETEITSGTPVAIVGISYGTAAKTHFSNTWACPLTALNSTDNIVIRVYGRFGPTGTWVLLTDSYGSTHLTEQLGAQSLDSATWTVHYIGAYWYYAPTKLYILEYAFGDKYPINSTYYRSQIDNFTWTEGAVGGQPYVSRVQHIAGMQTFNPIHLLKPKPRKLI